MSTGSVWALLCAAGRGTRMGADGNKVLMPLGGMAVLARTARALCAARQISGICVVCAQGEQQHCRELIAPVLGGRQLLLAAGGATRQQSVYLGLQALEGKADIVLIHDAARPLVDTAIIASVLQAAKECGGGIPGVAVRDTLKRVDGQGRILHTAPREGLWQAQTPQGFRLDLILAAHRQARQEGFEATDDAQLMERAGLPVRMVAGSTANLKLTTPEDVRTAEGILRMREGAAQMQVFARSGMGYDVHALVKGRPLVLGGVTVPHPLGLLGHSDADVATHALMDALLGAAGLGDIGTHFPDTDERYRGADSVALLRDVIRLIGEAGFAPGNADITIAAQRPKLAPHIPQMRETLARAMGVPAGCVNVKATTTERLGFEGREQGISAYAVATVIPKG